MIIFNHHGAIRCISAATETPFIRGYDTCIANIAADGRVLGGAFITNYTGCGGSVQLQCAGFSPNWLNRVLLGAYADYCFNVLSVSRIVGIIPSGNSKALRLEKHLGFREEAIIKGLFTYEGKEQPGVVLSLTKDRCKYLNLRYLRG